MGEAWSLADKLFYGAFLQGVRMGNDPQERSLCVELIATDTFEKEEDGERE